MKDDLWGVIPAPDTTPLPLCLLKEQGTLLAEKTNGLLTGQTHVEYEFHEGGELTILKFYIVCPTLNNYRYEVLSVLHPRFGDVFPAEIFFYRSDGGEDTTVASDLGEFKTRIKNILQSDRVKKVVSALLRDAQEVN